LKCRLLFRFLHIRATKIWQKFVCEELCKDILIENSGGDLVSPLTFMNEKKSRRCCVVSNNTIKFDKDLASAQNISAKRPIHRQTKVSTWCSANGVRRGKGRDPELYVAHTLKFPEEIRYLRYTVWLSYNEPNDYYLPMLYGTERI